MLNFIKKIFSKKYKLYYFGRKKSKNAGDIFNVDLMKYYNIPYKRSRKIEKANLICVGSNVEKLAIPSKNKMIIAGGGFIFSPKREIVKREIDVLALRDELTKQKRRGDPPF